MLGRWLSILFTNPARHVVYSSSTCSVIRMNNENLTLLALGCDLTQLGLNLNASVCISKRSLACMHECMHARIHACTHAYTQASI